jgi:DNA-directed RNA polymerase specialized sigma24 family protein
MPQSTGKRATRSVEELETAILNMTADEQNRLSAVGRVLQGSTGMTWEDLLQEAYARAYERRRTWHEGVDVVRFLIGAMESIADEARNAAARHTLTGVFAGDSSPANTEGLTSQTGVLFEVRHATPSAEDAAIAREAYSAEAARIRGWRDRLLAAFDDDEEGQFLLIGMMDGLRGEGLRAVTGLTEAQFATKYKKVQRRIQVLQKEGKQP